MLKKTELKRRDFREYRNFCRYFCIPYGFVLELEQLAKNRKGFSLAARNVGGRQYVPIVLKDTYCQFCRKCDVVLMGVGKRGAY